MKIEQTHNVFQRPLVQRINDLLCARNASGVSAEDVYKVVEEYTWTNAATKPITYDSVIIAGVLEDEEWRDSHEGFWDGRQWWSARHNDAGKRMKINEVTHWMPRPAVPQITPDEP